MRYITVCIFFLIVNAAFSQESEATEASLEDIEFLDSLAAAEKNYMPFKQGEKWTLYDLDSGIVNSKYTFDAWLPQGKFSEYFAFKKDGLFGVIDYQGDTIMPFEYDTIVTTFYGVFGSKGSNWVFPQYFDSEVTSDTLQLDSISGKGDFVYLYRNNKVGAYSQGIISVPPIFEAVQPLNVVAWYDKSPEVILAFDGSAYRFFDYKGNDLLGTATPEFELMRNDFVRFKKNGRWWYYNFYTKKQFDSGGNDVVLYHSGMYKIYGSSRTYPTFYYDERKQSGYEDYFPLMNEYLAFRSAGKVGLMDGNGTVHIPARYDKIELIDSRLGYFKFFRGDSCGLVTKSGVELFQPAYANIIATNNPNRLIVIDNGFTGVVDKQGKNIIPLKYDYIHYDNTCFLLEKKELIGLASMDGKIIFEPQFIHYQREYGNTWDGSFYAIVFEDFKGKLLLANSTGALTTEKFNDYNYGNQTFKLYRNNEIEVLVLTDKTEVEESVKYPNVGSLVVKKEDSNKRVRWGLGGWDISYLEENQLNGKFGLRFFRKQGLAVEAVYNEIQSTGLDGHFGERKEEGTFELTDNIVLDQKAVYDHMYEGNARIQNKDLVSAESVVFNASSNWTSTVVAQNNNHLGTIEVPHEYMPFQFRELEEMNLGFSRQFGTNLPKMYIIDAKPVVCSIDSAEISLFEYYHYFNMLGGLRMTSASAPQIMNPNLGVRFEGGQRRVTDLNAFEWNESRLRFKPWKSFKDFRFTQMEDFILFKDVDDSLHWTVQDYRWTKDGSPIEDKTCLDFKEVSFGFETILELKEEGTTNYIIHEDFPDFEYILSDSVQRNYFVGRLILEEKEGVRLKDPKGNVFTPFYRGVRYLGEGIFTAKTDAGWEVINRNGNRVIDRYFTYVGAVNNGFFAARNASAQGIYSVEGEVLVESSETLKHVEGNFYQVTESPQEIWYDAQEKMYDTLQADEVYLGNRTFLVNLEDNEYTLRKFGTAQPLKIASEITPYCINGAVVFLKKNKLFVLDSNGLISTYKKASKPREVGKFLRIDGKKNQLILDPSGNLIHTTTESARLKAYRDLLLVHTSDSTYYISQTGAIVSKDALKVSPIAQPSEKEIEIILGIGKVGASKNGKTLIEPNYDRLSYTGNGEFEAIRNYTTNLFDGDLKQMNPIPYHNCYFIDEDLMILELNGTWYFFKKGEKWERINTK